MTATPHGRNWSGFLCSRVRCPQRYADLLAASSCLLNASSAADALILSHGPLDPEDCPRGAALTSVGQSRCSARRRAERVARARRRTETCSSENQGENAIRLWWNNAEQHRGNRGLSWGALQPLLEQTFLSVAASSSDPLPRQKRLRDLSRRLVKSLLWQVHGCPLRWDGAGGRRGQARRPCGPFGPRALVPSLQSMAGAESVGVISSLTPFKATKGPEEGL